MDDTTLDENTRARGIAAPTVPGYTILGELGRGGMGAVYRAKDRSGAEVALKVVTSSDQRFVERFAREISAAQRIPSPHVVRVLAYGLEPLPHMATEIVDGGSLKRLLERGRLPVPLAIRFFDDLLAGLAAAHGEGVLHRDVKPQNLLIASDGRLKVADFGVARLTDESSLTSTGGIVGTPAYMSPEQALAQKLDGASDLFSAGIVLFEMVTGEHPFRADSPAATLLKITKLRHRLASEVAPLIPDDLDALIERLLRERPRRIGSAAAARAALAPLVQLYGASRADVVEYLRDQKAARASADSKLRAAEIKHARRALAQRRADVAAATTIRLVRAWPRDPDVIALLRDTRREALVAERPSMPAVALLRRAEQEPEPIPTLKEAARQARKDGDVATERIAHAHVLQLLDDEDSVSAVRPFLPAADTIATRALDILSAVARFLWALLASPWRFLVGHATHFQDPESRLGRSGIQAIAILILIALFGSCAMCARCTGQPLFGKTVKTAK